MAAGDVHTYKKDGRWVNKVEGNKRISNHAPTKKEAKRLGRALANKRGSEQFVYRADGELERHIPRVVPDGRGPTPGQKRAAGGPEYARMLGRAAR